MNRLVGPSDAKQQGAGLRKPERFGPQDGTLWLCHSIAIENGHRNSGFTHEKNSDFP